MIRSLLPIERRRLPNGQRAADERAIALAEAQASKYVPRWVFRRERGSMWSIVNESDETAYGVLLSGAEPDAAIAGMITRLPTDPAELQPSSALSFFAQPHGGTSDTRITVTWHRAQDLADPLLTWRSPLPGG